MRIRGLAAPSAILLLTAMLLAMLTACSGLVMPAGSAPVGLTGAEIAPEEPTTGTAAAGTPSTAATTPTSPPEAAPDGWRRITPPPLTPREGAAAAWTGHELIILGGHGRPACPTGDACPVADEPLADGAAYDPDSDTWRRIADHPLPDSQQVIGTDGGVVVGRPDEVLWRYDAEMDTWQRVPTTRDGLDQVAVAGDRMAAYAATQEVIGPPDQVRDPDTGRWRPLPPDPLGLTRDRRMIWVGEDLVLLGVPIDPQLGDLPPVRAAWLEDPLGEDPDWHLLPESVALPGGDWIATDHGVVDLGPPDALATTGDGAHDPADRESESQDVGDPRSRPAGGILRLDPAGWFDLPALPPDLDAPAAIRMPPAGGGRTALAAGRALDLVTGTWAAIPEDPALPTQAPVMGWAGDRLLVWGGHGGAAWVWLPPWAGQPDDGTAVALQPQQSPVAAGPTPPSGVQAHPDARIDCLDEALVSLTDLSAGEDAGMDTAARALRAHLHPQALHDGGRVVIVEEIHASVVVDDRETVSATALRQPDGDWVVGLLTACGDVDLIIR